MALHVIVPAVQLAMLQDALEIAGFVRVAAGWVFLEAFVRTHATVTATLLVATEPLECALGLVNLVTTIQHVPVYAAHIAETGHANVLMEHAPSARLVTTDLFVTQLAVNVTVRAVTKPRGNVLATVKLGFTETSVIRFAPAIASLHHAKSQTDIVQHVKMDISV